MNDWIVLAAGIHSAAFALFHIAFWRLFRWRDTLQRATPVDRAVIQILNLRLTYVFAMVAALCFAFPVELHSTPLGRAVLAGMALFWVGRTVEQFIFLRINRPAMQLLTAAFVLGAVLFAWPLLA